MSDKNFINNRVSQYYWHDDINCATTIIKVLSEVYKIKVDTQVLDSAIGMHGAGGYGAQCGLVEGALMFIGIFGTHHKIPDNIIAQKCHEYAKQYEETYMSLQCSILRPEGFKADNPPHLCENLTCSATDFTIKFISKIQDEIEINQNFLVAF